MKLSSPAAVSVFLLFTSPGSVGGQTSNEIPPHPRALDFARVTPALPTAEGRSLRLDSGPLVFFAEDHTLPLVEIALAFRVGSFLDPPGKAGLASLTGALIRRAGTGEMTAAEMDLRIDQLGARLDSFAGKTRAGASLSAPTWAADEALELFIQMLRQPAFDEDRLRSARQDLLEGMKRRNEDPLAILEREWEWLMFGDRHFSTLPLTAESVEAITREDLVRHHQRYWRPQDMLLAVSGDFDRERMSARLEELFSDWPAAASPADEQTSQSPVGWPPAEPPAGVEPGLFHLEVDVPQAKIALGHRAVKRLDWLDSERFALAVALETLGGGGAISRLAGRLRTAEGLVYRASAVYETGALWPEYFQVFFDTDGQNAPRAIALTLEEIGRLRSESIHPRELQVVKQTLLSRLRLSFDTAEEISGRFAEDRLLGRPHFYWESYRRGIEEVTSAQVLEASHRFLRPDELVFLVVGRWSDLSDGQPAGESEVERITGHRATRLPARDPLSMEPLD